MPPQLASVLFVAGIAGLFWLDRDTSVRTSKALWLPVLWLVIASTGSISFWLGMGPPMEVAGQIPESSLLDQLIAAFLMLLAVIVLVRRGKEVTSLLKASWPITLYFSFCLISLAWSDFPAWGFKRWVRALGDLVMVLIIATDAQPIAALKRLIMRLGFVLLPVSVLWIRYYPSLGQGWDEYGFRTFQGVTSNKNALGNLVYLVGLGALWQILTFVRDKENPDRRRHLLAQGTLVAVGINLLYTAQCATGTACFILGTGLMLALSLPLFRRSTAAVHALVLTFALVGGVGYLLGAKAAVTEALGRKPDFTGRTAIWQIVIPMAPNPIGGAGFETFWVGPRVAEVARKVNGFSMTNEAHNGYIETYLNLGVLGLGFIALLFGQGYLKAGSLFRRDPALGGLMIAYFVTAVTFNVTEAGFRMLSLEWFFLLLSIVAVNRANLPDATPEPGPEPIVPVRPRWATPMSPDPVPMGAGVKTGLSRDAIATRSQRKEPPATQFLVGDKKTRT
jgi:O-antigen ligase